MSLCDVSRETGPDPLLPHCPMTPVTPIGSCWEPWTKGICDAHKIASPEAVVSSSPFALPRGVGHADRQPLRLDGCEAERGAHVMFHVKRWSAPPSSACRITLVTPIRVTWEPVDEEWMGKTSRSRMKRWSAPPSSVLSRHVRLAGRASGSLWTRTRWGITRASHVKRWPSTPPPHVRGALVTLIVGLCD